MKKSCAAPSILCNRNIPTTVPDEVVTKLKATRVESYEKRWDIAQLPLTQRLPATQRPRWVMQHNWKCGGTNLCQLARENGWNVPPSIGCTIWVEPARGWAAEDYDLFGNERPIPDGAVRRVYGSQNQLTNETSGVDAGASRLYIDDVQYVTIVRHPYPRSLSHYYHRRKRKVMTKKQFFVPCMDINGTNECGSYDRFIPDQQTRWHCGSNECIKAKHLQPEHFEHAFQNLLQFDVILILEDMDRPDSCTRLQLRHIMNFTVEEFPANSTRYRGTNSNMTKDWETTLNQSGVEIAETLRSHNAFDMRLYNMARKVCEERASIIHQHIDECGYYRCCDPCTGRVRGESNGLVLGEVAVKALYLQTGRFASLLGIFGIMIYLYVKRSKARRKLKRYFE